ncbi:MAG: hypothetical protein RL059_137 [Bacteroidota bacterium]|jgi:hypothetical protein
MGGLQSIIGTCLKAKAKQTSNSISVKIVTKNSENHVGTTHIGTSDQKTNILTKIGN